MSNDAASAESDGQFDIQQSQNASVRIYILAESDYAVDGIVSIIGNAGEGFEVIKIASPDAASDFSCYDVLKKHHVNLILVHHSAISGQVSAYIKSLQKASNNAKILIFGQNMENEFLYNMLKCGVQG